MLVVHHLPCWIHLHKPWRWHEPSCKWIRIYFCLWKVRVHSRVLLWEHLNLPWQEWEQLVHLLSWMLYLALHMLLCDKWIYHTALTCWLKHHVESFRCWVAVYPLTDGAAEQLRLVGKVVMRWLVRWDIVHLLGSVKICNSGEETSFIWGVYIWLILRLFVHIF